MVESLLKSLKANNINGYFAKNSEEAKELALGLIPKNSVVGMGNSLTLRQTNIFDSLASGNYQLINQFEPGITPEENLRRRRESLLSDVYFTGVNAISLNGELINIDGKGNRVAAIMFGPQKVVIVAGKNKIVNDEEEAWERLKMQAAPALAKKLGRNTPCAKTGTCSDCASAERICRCYTVIKGQMPADKDRIHVIIVDENLGI